MIGVDAMSCNARRAGDLGLRQEHFVEEYLVDLNATQAALRAGYSPKTAEAQGSRLLSHVKVQRAITARMAERSKRTEVAADRALLEIARIAFSDLRRLFHEDGRDGQSRPGASRTLFLRLGQVKRPAVCRAARHSCRAARHAIVYA
jgi:Terminase small subunit